MGANKIRGIAKNFNFFKFRNGQEIISKKITYCIFISFFFIGPTFGYIS
jgi:hypothetical protein